MFITDVTIKLCLNNYLCLNNQEASNNPSMQNFVVKYFFHVDESYLQQMIQIDIQSVPGEEEEASKEFMMVKYYHKNNSWYCLIPVLLFTI